MEYAVGYLAGDTSVLGEGFTASTLSERFKEVLDSTKHAWYVDYFTDFISAPMFRIRYFSEEPLVAWTSDDLASRDSDDKEGTQWGAEDIKEWFGEDLDTYPNVPRYAHTLTFEVGDKTHVLRVAADDCTIDGDPYEDGDGQSTWDRYVDLGFKGALEPFKDDFDTLTVISLEIEEVK